MICRVPVGCMWHKVSYPQGAHVCAGMCIVSVVVDSLVSRIDSHNLRWLLSCCWLLVGLLRAGGCQTCSPGTSAQRVCAACTAHPTFDCPPCCLACYLWPQHSHCLSKPLRPPRLQRLAIRSDGAFLLPPYGGAGPQPLPGRLLHVYGATVMAVTAPTLVHLGSTCACGGTSASRAHVGHTSVSRSGGCTVARGAMPHAFFV
jgi:hypothetical protein